MRHVKRAVFLSKSPKSITKHIGIEIEFCSPINRDKLGDMLHQAQLNAYVTLKDDGSIEPEPAEECHGDCRDNCECGEDGCFCECDCRDYAHELCVLAPQKKLATIIRRVCDVLRQARAYVNQSCGLHVHIDMRDRAVIRAYRNLYRAQDLLFSLVPRRRRNNSYCRRQDEGSLFYAARGERYRAINPTAITEHESIEIRLHPGTTNAKKILRWVNLLVLISDSRKINRVITTLDELAQCVRLSADLSEYLKTRWAKFNTSQHAEHADESEVA